MAVASSLSILSLILSLFNVSLARNLYTTTVLDVASSNQQARDILSFDPLQARESSTQQSTEPWLFSNTSSFSLNLHSREIVYKTSVEDYKSLVLTRLERDSARVDSLNTKLNLALKGINKQDLKPVEVEIQLEDLSTPVVSGTSQGSGEYFTRVGVGSPAKEFYMVLDTGSDVNWLQCQPCSDCYQQSDPIFNPAASTSYSPLTCDSPQCRSLETSGCQSDKCLYQVAYGDGSYTVGELVTETVSFANSGAVNNIALGCGHDNEGLFVASAGLLGLGGGKLSLTSQIKANSFSYCLVDRDSPKSSTLDFNSAQLGDSVTAPLMRNSKIDTFYYVQVIGMSVGGQPVSIPPELFQMDDSGRGGIIVDCGTAITRLQTQAYNSLRDSFTKLTTNLRPTNPVALFDTCYDMSSLSTVRVPTVAFRFAGGMALDLPAKNYLIPVDSSGTYCFAFAPTSSPLSIIGNVQQQGIRVSYDLANNRVGFSPNKC
ncbi:protein ASPARTIC PROTEASE IN GUARD CELL 1 [Tripterygium wilfordii]|uniref:Protein ASPARTIC PROTEASE IN GUARD CELL 1 n=1 Tax=Tripterygium wilfordii TaxID=458696 RepID=A0A7J7CIU4_TRIWF|nr:protein ASPARTIC PROTEASE IN GUARD CELL 1-like [Tripterygium wilfordii]KAF5733982.1 protein ASPARTIC PROTEASE IN GUARD CELL 1 [Tripterygium wilfordii]